MLTRRDFIRTTTAAASVLGFPNILRSASPNSNVQIAVIGCAGQGFSDLMEIGGHQKVKFTAFCDVDTSRFDGADKHFPGVTHFQDYREMFAKMGDQIDGVQISTPDNLHAIVTMEAFRRGKHVYCQKPLTQTVWEARQIRLAAERYKVVTQMGNQIHSSQQYRTGVKILRDGVIGKIKEVHAWVGNRGNQFTGLTERPKDKVQAPPSNLNWDLWIGPAPMRDYVPGIYAPFNWRDWCDFGGGGLGDFGCHILDPIFTALEIKDPKTITAENTGVNAETWPGSETITYEFAGNQFTAGDTLKVVWHDGGRKPDRALAQMPDGKELPANGSLCIGEEGTMVLPHIAKAQVYPADKFASKQIESVPGGNHYHLWVDAIINGGKCTAGFHYAGPLTETVQLGNVATRVPGKRLEWDAAALKFANSPEADKLLTREYRKGFELGA